jgi:hypothetical protein
VNRHHPATTLCPCTFGPKLADPPREPADPEHGQRGQADDPACAITDENQYDTGSGKQEKDQDHEQSVLPPRHHGKDEELQPGVKRSVAECRRSGGVAARPAEVSGYA